MPPCITHLRAAVVLVLQVGAILLAQAVCLAEEPVDLKRVRTVHVPADANAAEVAAADEIQSRLEAMYGLALKVEAAAPQAGAPAILVGRASVDAGVITRRELEAVRHDGYVIKAADDRITLAGHGPQGTITDAWAGAKTVALGEAMWRTAKERRAISIEEFVGRHPAR